MLPTSFILIEVTLIKESFSSIAVFFFVFIPVKKSLKSIECNTEFSVIMPHGPRPSTNVPPPLLIGIQLRGPKITKRYLKSSRLPSKTRPSCSLIPY